MFYFFFYFSPRNLSKSLLLIRQAAISFAGKGHVSSDLVVCGEKNSTKGVLNECVATHHLRLSMSRRWENP